MTLKNAYSGATSSLDKIQKILTTHGAHKVMFDYAKDSSGRLEAISFGLEIRGEPRGFRLPAMVENVTQILYGGKDRYGHEKKITPVQRDQAYRTAWANIRDWIDAQMALIDTQQAKLEQVFLSYMVTDNNQTVFERLQNTQFALPAGK